jgi:hypothetical protein
MKLHRLRVASFAAIREADITFGPGLNVLYGPNDLGKSTLADSIRLALLLPFSSTYYDVYKPWSGAGDPRVELTFQTEEQRFWRVCKQFGHGGWSRLEESRDGQDFAEVEHRRRVDAKLREILGWGIPEPGGAGAGKGLPTSFLATALLSTQALVTDVLYDNLHDDSTASGKERIAAALQAVAQDPLFLALLRAAQARRDEAYTDKGAKKTARGSVFKAAADRLKGARDEKERLQKLVEDSDGVEEDLRALMDERGRLGEERAAAADRLAEVERFARQAVDREEAAGHVGRAREALLRIQRMDQDVADAEKKVGELVGLKNQAEQDLADAQAAEAAAGDALKNAEEEARAAGLDSGMADTMARQELELRKAAAELTAQEAQQRLEAAARAQRLVDDAVRAEDDHRKQEAEALRARGERATAAEAEQAANEELRRCDLLERALHTRTAEKQVADARADVEREAALQAERMKVSEKQAAAAALRATFVVPPPASLAALRKLDHDLAISRGALDVGLVMTVTPAAPIDLEVRKDGAAADRSVIEQPLDIEADAEVEVRIAELATVRVRGGRREAQERVRALEVRWEREVQPHLAAAGAAGLDALDAKAAEARELDSRIKALEGELESLQQQIAALAGAAETLRQASAGAADCRLALGDATLETLAADLLVLGPDPGGALRARRQQASRDAETARTAANEAASAQILAEERVRISRATLAAALTARDAALVTFPSGIAAMVAAARESLQSSLAEQEKVNAALASLESTIEARRQQHEEAIGRAKAAAAKARHDVEAAREARTKVIRDHATDEGRLTELRRLRAAEDLTAAERALREAAERRDALPVPERPVTAEEVTEAGTALATIERVLASTDRQIHITQGRLQEVGGAVARERLRDAVEAFELAERHEREIEADYEAWKLLLEQMKEADAAQASNLGQALAPAIADRFQALTRQRYQRIQLSAQLATEGVLVAGEVRSPDRISVGTREQLATLYRLCLGEYLRTTIVLDDQLVQSDHHRMDWFRAQLAEKARSFQIVVFTCRPNDYLDAAALVTDGGSAHLDTDDGFVRAIDLGRVVQRW